MAPISDLAALVRSGGAVFTAGFVHRVARGASPLHRHAGFEIVHHRGGRGRSRIEGGGEVAFADGDVVIYAPGVRHDQIQEAVGSDACIHVAVSGALPRGLPACFQLAAPADPWLRRELTDLSGPVAAASDLEQLSLDLRAGALLIRLLAEAGAMVPASGPASAGDAIADRADRHIAAQFREIGRVEEVALHLGIGYDHLRHVYRRRFGRSLVRRLIEARVGHACALLVHAPIPVAQVAAEAGYATARHFAAVFRSVTGVTPAAYRQRLRSTGGPPERREIAHGSCGPKCTARSVKGRSKAPGAASPARKGRRAAGSPVALHGVSSTWRPLMVVKRLPQLRRAIEVASSPPEPCQRTVR
jgi:AraC-like DNA-binding protein/quercetin dioxygenase-like cupin family protein